MGVYLFFIFMVDILNIKLYHKPTTAYNETKMGVHLFFMLDILNINLYLKPVTSYNVM
jgi:hypothetical protein